MFRTRKMIKAMAIILTSLFLASCTNTMSNTIHPPKNNKFLPSYEGNVTGKKNKNIPKIKRVYNLNAHNQDLVVPIILPPEIRPIWIVDHVNENGDFIRGHWVFIKIRNSMWYIQAITRKDFKDIMRELTSESQ